MTALKISVEPELPPFPSEPLVKAPFCIDSPGACDWYLSKLAAIDAEIALLTAQHEQAVKRLQSDRQGLENLFQHQAETWARREIAQDRKGRRSIILPHGTVALRTVPAGIKIADTQAAMEFALTSRPEAVRTVQTLDLTQYRQWAESRLHNDGELLPGVEFVPERESFSVKFPNSKDGK